METYSKYSPFLHGFWRLTVNISMSPWIIETNSNVALSLELIETNFNSYDFSQTHENNHNKIHLRMTVSYESL